MGFLDNMDFARSVPSAPRAPTMPRAQSAFSPAWGINKSGGNLWGSLSSGAFRPQTTTPTKGPAAAPERIDVRLGVSGEPPPPPPKDPLATAGDFLGSAGAAIGNVAGKLNLANAIPWFMERNHELASAIAETDIPIVSQAAGIIDIPLGGFIDGVHAVSEKVAPVLEAFPNWYRDSQLGDKAKVYRAIVTGQSVMSEFNPLEGFFMSSNLLPGTKAGARQISNEYEALRALLAQSLDPNDQDKARTAINILRDSVDLPESVKNAIEANPNADLEKLLDEAPEGRQFSYEPGVSGFIANLGMPLLFYLAEYKFAMGAAGAARMGLVGTTVPGAAGVPGGLAGMLGRAGLGTASRAVQTGTAAAVRATTIAAKLQKASLGAGVTVAVLTTTMDAIARTQGNQAAIDWYDRVTRTTEFSDDPDVQLVTGFMVNPFEAVGLAKRGIIKMAHGIDSVIVTPALGQRFARNYTHETLTYDLIRRMYKLGSVDEGREWVAKNYESKGVAYNEVVGAALDKVLDSVPREERLMFNSLHAGGIARTNAALPVYGDRIMELLEKHPDEVAKRWRERTWEHHDFRGPFSPELAALLARDMRGARAKNYEFRAAEDAVVAYTELLPPRGAALARSWLDQVTDANGNVKVGYPGLDDLNRMLPSIRKHQAGLVPGGAKTIPRTTIEEIIRRAEVEYALTSKRSPIKAATGAEPVIRPDSPTLTRDYAEAMGTTPATVKALEDFNLSKPDAGHVELLRTFVADKLDMEPASAAAMDPVQVWTAASDYFGETTRPWVDAGERIVNAEKRQVAVRNELARLARVGVKREAHTEAIRELEAELSNLLRITREAGDPIVPFSREVHVRGVVEKQINKIRSMDPAKLSQADDSLLREFLLNELQLPSTGLLGAALHQRVLDAIPTVTEGRVATARDAHLAETAQRKVQALEVLRTLDAIDGQAEAMMPRKVADIPWHQLLRRTPEGNLGWAGGTLPVSEAMRRRIAAYLRNQGGPGRAIAADMLFKGDAEVWEVLSRYPGAMEGFTVAQRRYVLAARGASPDRTGIDEWADAWQKQNDSTSEAFLEELTRLHEARAEALAGRMEHNLRRTGEMKVPPVYLTEAEIAQSGRDLWVDAEFEVTFHPMNVAKVRDILDNPGELYVRLRDEIYGDNRLLNEAVRIAQSNGVPIEELLRDPIHASKLKALIPEDFDPPIPGLAVPETEVDALIVARDPAIARLAEADVKPAVPVTMLLSRAEDIAGKAVRPSVKYRRDLVGSGADMRAAPDGAILDDPANALGLDVLSYLNRGVTGTKPATTAGVIELLREIENGHATARGIGLSLQAEGQRVAMKLLASARNAAKREGIEAGVYTHGEDAALMAQDDLDLLRTLDATIDPNTGLPKRGGIPAVTYDPADPLGTLQYGLKKRPKDKVVMEWAQVPGLTEEFLAGHFQPWSERVWTAQVRHAYNWVFGKRGNEAIAMEVRGRFVERAGKDSVDPEIAGAIWDRWKAEARRSRPTDIEKRPQPVSLRATAAEAAMPGLREEFAAGHGLPKVAARPGEDLTALGFPARPMQEHVPGENPQYGDIRNIPSKELDRWAKEEIDEIMAGRNESVSPYRSFLMTNRYDDLFREASSFTRRHIADAKIPLGDKLAGMYGFAAHNEWVTTMYYQFRFKMDIRYHAMNYWEAQILGFGRAGFRAMEATTGFLGASKAWFQRLSDNPADNVGYPFSRRRAEVAYRTFAKEQPGKLREGLRGLAAEDPRLMENALVELAAHDPELSKTILLMGDSVDQYLGAMNAHWKKIMRGVDEVDDAKTVDEAFAKAMSADPALAEVYGRLAQINKDLVGDIRNTFYGNAERSRAERFLNSYLLYWPISYQIKAAKWMFRVLYDRAGGLQTNAAGAVMLDRALSAHQRLLATDPTYQDWYEKHDTLLFIASQLIPITPTSMGVSLSPPLRALFGRERSMFEIGPIYTLGLVKQAAPEAYADMYATLGDVPGMDEVFRAVTGRTQKAPVDALGQGDRP